MIYLAHQSISYAIIMYYRSSSKQTCILHTLKFDGEGITYLGIRNVIIRILSQAPDLIQHTAIAPYITCSGVLAVKDSLGGCPLHWDQAVCRYVVGIFHQISRHAKVTNLYSSSRDDYVLVWVFKRGYLAFFSSSE